MADVSITKEWISFNDKLCDILGYTPKELKNISWEQLTHPDDLATETRLYNQILTHETEFYSIEKRFVKKNSKVVPCKVTVKSVKTLTGNISHLIKLVEDISERKRTEAELIESRSKLSHAQSVAKLGTIRFVPESNLISLSNEAYEILGFGSKRPVLSRRDLFKTIIPDSQTRFEEHICNLESGADVEGSHEQTIITPKGEVKYTLTNFGKVLDENKKIIEVVATLADITRIKQAEMSLVETNALKDQILSIIGHDLRSPIGSMKQLIDIYAESWKEFDKDSAESIIKTLQETSGETYKLLENLLEWAKSQKSTSFKPEKTDLVLLAEQVVKLSRNVAEGKGVLIQESLPEKAVAIVDVEMIKTVIRNLIGNSIKFTPSGGMISVSISEVEGQYSISISDTGKGITEEDKSKIFDSSITFSTLGTNSEKGTGLGLKLVKKFVEKNGGEISVESIEGQGSTFFFTVPKYIEHE
jgi:PAS domain S-box-containing protein